MREKTNRGARVPLFERLIDLEPAVSWEPQPLRTFDEAGVKASVRNAVSRILNSRSNVPEHLRQYVRGTVLDFGIPDTTTYSPTSETDRVALGDLIARSIALFEPRLRDVSIVIEPDPTNPRALLALLRASMTIDSKETAVSFPLTIDSGGADATPEEPPEPQISARAHSAGK